ncbi:ABC transporter ATP-binding protein [Frankia sp. Cppng1_Ct_nod]|uniref:dipeptide ABC transporter ATP-binding protein n=1 Tax=Frankia sp. Cppng1_Ct_nod TaxID=2897162 RepID=UPI002025162C|nr:ABC transporter ATP-binding protein [Frankia sp. Cppng1_Ct_nod]
MAGPGADTSDEDTPGGIVGAPSTSEVPVLEIDNLEVSYRGRLGVIHAVRGVGLTVRSGEVVALVGGSGSGKSTTAHAVLGLLPAGGQVDGGRVMFAGADLTQVGERDLRVVRGAGIGLVPQDPSVALNPVLRIGDQVSETLRIHGLVNRRAAAAAAVGALAEAGLSQPAVRARQYPHELSGGMRQRVLIAIAVAAGPRLLIADEPTSALDVTVQRQILDHIGGLVRDRGTAVLLVTHDLGIALERADRVVVLHAGRVVEAGPADQVIGEPSHPYTRQLVADAPSLSGSRLRSGPAPTPQVRTTATATATIMTTTETAVVAGPDIPPLIVVEDLVKEFALPRSAGHGKRSVRAVDGVSFTIGHGETFALVGESGSGKTTMARLITRLATPSAGRVTMDGQDISQLRGGALRRFRQRVQLVYQNPYASLNPRFTIAEVVEEPLRIFGVGDRASRRDRVRELLERVALSASVLSYRPAELSGGECQRVAIARALAPAPRLVVCDEPVSALDVSAQTRVLELLIQLQADLGLSFLFISHDLGVVRRVADHVGVMRAGRLLEVGLAGVVLTAPRDAYTRLLLNAIPGRRAASPAP